MASSNRRRSRTSEGDHSASDEVVLSLRFHGICACIDAATARDFCYVLVKTEVAANVVSTGQLGRFGLHAIVADYVLHPMKLTCAAPSPVLTSEEGERYVYAVAAWYCGCWGPSHAAVQRARSRAIKRVAAASLAET